MAITKMANGLLALPIHIAQNQAMKHLLDNKTFHKGLWQKFYNGATGNQHLSRDAAALMHIGTPVLPEIGVLADEAHRAGKQLAPHLTGGDPNLRQLVQLRRVARGQFNTLKKRPLNEAEIGLAKTLYGKYLPAEGAADFEHLLRNMSPEKAAQLEELAKKNPLTGKLLNGVANQSHMPSPKASTPGSISDRHATKYMGLPAEVAVNGTLLALDPTTLAVNVGKRALFSHSLGNRYKTIKKVQDYGNNVLTNTPIKNALATGGVRRKGRLETLYDKYISPEVVNPLNAYAIDLAEGIGKIKNTP